MLPRLIDSWFTRTKREMHISLFDNDYTQSIALSDEVAVGSEDANLLRVHLLLGVALIRTGTPVQQNKPKIRT